jgi:hypothetical protein
MLPDLTAGAGGISQTAADRCSELIMGGSWVEGNNVITAKLKKRMVGTWGLEPQTSTVSKRLSAVTYYTLTALTASL